ncbi:MAG: putative PEP-binding protein, partial [Cyanobium sp.]
ASVLAMIRLAIRSARSHGRPIGLCGQAPSDHQEFAGFLVEEGIDSISLNPDAVVSSRIAIAALERERSVELSGELSDGSPAPPG